MKTHHALVDAGSGMGLSELLCDFEPNPAPRPPAAMPEPEAVPSDIELLARGALSALTSPARTALWAVEFVPRTVRNVRTVRRLGGRTVLDRAPTPVPFVGTLGTLRRFAYTSLPLEDIKRIKNVHGVTVNDVILAVASGAVRRWLVARDLLPEKSLVASVPMSLRAEGDTELGAKVAPLFCDLETQIEDPVARLHGIAARMGAVKEVGNTLKAKEIRHLTDAIPPALVSLAARAYRGAHLETMSFVPANLAVSNIAGSPRPLYLAGRPDRGHAPRATEHRRVRAQLHRHELPRLRRLRRHHRPPDDRGPVGVRRRPARLVRRTHGHHHRRRHRGSPERSPHRSTPRPSAQLDRHVTTCAGRSRRDRDRMSQDDPAFPTAGLRVATEQKPGFKLFAVATGDRRNAGKWSAGTRAAPDHLD